MSTPPGSFARQLRAAALSLVAIALTSPTLKAQSPTPLRPGTAVERQITGGGADSYAVQLTKGQVLEATVMQNGVDVVVAVFGPDGHELDRVDSPTGLNAPEHVSLMAHATGTYRVEVAPLERVASAGKYTISLQPPKMASAAEQQVLAREQELNRADGERDRDAFLRLLAPGVTWVGMRGHRSDREALATATRSASNKVSIVSSQLRVRLFGDAAVVSGHQVIADSARGTALERDFTRTWVQQNGQWMLASSQFTGAIQPIRSERVDPAVLDAYAGQYRATEAEANAGADETFTLTREGDQLIYQRGAERMPVYPEAPGVFYTNNLHTRLVFVPGSDGSGMQMLVLPYISGGRVQILRKAP